MDPGISRIGSSLNTRRANRVNPKKDREREEQADFAEAMEHRDHEDDEEASMATDETTRLEGPDVGYPTDGEAGTSLDLTA